MSYTKLALFSLFFTACGTTIALLLGWYLAGPAMPNGTMLLLSLLGAGIGAFTSWRYVSKNFPFDGAEDETAGRYQKNRRQPRAVS